MISWGLPYYIWRARQRQLQRNPNVSNLLTYIYAPNGGPLLATTSVKATDDKQLQMVALFDNG